MVEVEHLTKLLTRATFDADLAREVERASQLSPLSLIVADIDHFKKVNDTSGHQVGDAVLTEVARRLAGALKGKGHGYRYGGEEFAVILPNHTSNEALAVAERIRCELEAQPIAGLSITSSYGIAVAPEHAKTSAELFKRADAAAYDAKSLGRNLVRLSGESAPTAANQPRKPIRKEAKPGTISDERLEGMRMELLRTGQAYCPFDDGIPLDVHNVTAYGDIGKSFHVHCPACGWSERLQSPRRE